MRLILATTFCLKRPKAAYALPLEQLLSLHEQASHSAISSADTVMECRDYVDLALGGSGNVELLQREVSSGRIKQTQLKMIALQMHEEVHGVFVEKRSHP